MLKHATAITLLATSMQGHALTLGAAQGQVVIGRPLELVIMAGAGASDAAGEQCLQAEVHYGDNRLPASEVTVTSLAPDGMGTPRWRVRVSQPVNEPIVTLQMRAGCSSSYTRSYALLADQDLAAAPPQRVLVPAALARARASTGEPSSRSVEKPKASDQAKLSAGPARQRKQSPEPSSRPAVSQAPISLPPPRPRPAGVERALAKSRPASVPEAVTEVAVAEKPVAMPAAPVATGPRLELDLIENSAMPFQLAGNGAATGTAVGLSALAPSQAPAVGVADPARPAGPVAAPGSLQAELEGLRAEQERMRVAVEAVHAQLAQARKPRWQDPLVLGLLGLSAASLLALAWTWLRLRRQRWA